MGLGVTRGAIVQALVAGLVLVGLPERPRAATSPQQPGARQAIAQRADAPATANARLAGGVDALKTGDLDAAEAIFRALLADGPPSVALHHNLGIVHQQRHDHAAAIADFDAAIRLTPDYGPAHLLRGSSLLALGRVDEATGSLERARVLLPKEPSARAELARAYERAGRLPEMTAAYRDAAALAPADPERAYQLGRAYLKLSAWSYARLEAIDPGSARVEQALALQHLQQGRGDRAFAALQRAAARDPALPEVHIALAQHFAERQQWAEARQALDRVLALVPSSRDALALKARVDAAAPR